MYDIYILVLISSMQLYPCLTLLRTTLMICSWSTLAYLIEDHLDDLLLVQPHPSLPY